MLQKKTKLPLFVRKPFLVVYLAFVLSCLVSVSIFAVSHPADASTPTLNFQARLLTSSGAVVPDGDYNVEFKIYSGSGCTPSTGSGCTTDWTEDYYGGSTDNRLRVADGYLSANLGSLTPFNSSIPWGQQLWLSINIGGTTDTSSPTLDGTMFPYLTLTSVPAAMSLDYTDGAHTATLSFTSTLSGNDSITLPDASGTVCLATSSGGNCSAEGTGYILNQSGTPGSAQTGNFDISGTGIAATLQAANFDTANVGTLDIGTTNATSVTIGSSSETGAITLGQATGGNTIEIGNGNTATGDTQIVNIGDGTDAGTGDAVVTVGNPNAASSTTVQGGTGGLVLQTGNTSSGSTGSIIIQSGNASSGTSGNVSIDTGASSVASGANVEDDTFESGTDGWINGYNTTGDAQSTAQAHSGTHSFAETSTDTSWALAGPYPGASINAGQLYDFSVWLRGTYAESVTLDVEWLGTTFNEATIGTVTDTTTGWTELTGSAVAPAGAQDAFLALNGADPGGYTTYIDDVTVSGGTSSPAITIGASNAADILIGNDNEVGATTLQGGSGGVDVTASTGSAITIGNTNSNSIAIGSSAGTEPLTLQGEGIENTIGGSATAPSDIIQTTTNSTTGFQVQNTNGISLLNVDTTHNQVSIGNSTTATSVNSWNGNSTNDSSLTVSPSTTGDLMMLAVLIKSTGDSVQSVTGGGVGSWKYVTGYTSSTSGVRTEIWEGTVTATGSSAITTTYASTPGVITELAAQEFTAGLGANTNWSVDAANSDDITTSSPTITFPSLTASQSGELYWGYEAPNNAGSAGSTPGFSYALTSRDNVIAYDPNLSQGTTYAPTASQTSSTTTGTAAIISASVGSALTVNGSATVTGTNSTTAFQIQNASGSSLLTADTTNSAIVLGQDGTPGAITVRGGAATGNDASGGNITFEASNGTGSGGSGSFVFQTASPTGSAIEEDNSGTDSDTGGSNMSLSYTTGSESDRLMLVQTTSGCGDTVANVTYDGTNLTQLSSENSSGTYCVHTEVWYMVAPTSGTHNLVVGLGDNAGTLGVSTFYNVNQSSPFGTVATATGTTTGVQASSLNVTASTSAQLVYDAISMDVSCGVVGTPGTGQTEISSYNTCSGLYADGASYKQGTSGTVNMSWDVSNADWVDIGVPINPLANSSADTLSDSLVIANNGNVGVDVASPTQTLDVGGTTLLQSTTNSSSALQVQNSAGNNLLSVDTSGDSVNVGTTGSTAMATTVNIDTSTGAAQTVNLGSSESTSTTTIQGGSGGVAVNAASSGSIGIGTTSASAITIGDGTGSESIILQANGITQTTTGGTTPSYVVQTNTNSTSAFQVEDSDNHSLFNVDTSGNNITLGSVSNLTGNLQFANSSSTDLVTLNAGDSVAAYSLTLPTDGATGTECLESTSGSTSTGTALQFASCGSGGGGSGSYVNNTASVQSANFFVQAASSGTVAGTLQANASGTGDILDLLNGSGTPVATFSSAGATLIKPSTNSTTAFQVQPSGSTTSVFDVDTTNGRVGINTNSPGYALDVNGVINSNTSVDVGGISVCTSTCIPSGGSGNYIQNGTSVQTAANLFLRSASSSAVVGILQGANGQTSDLLDLQSWNGTSSTIVDSFDASGDLTIGTTSTAALQVEDGSSNVLLGVDTSGDNVNIGANGSTALSSTVNIGTSTSSSNAQTVNIGSGASSSTTSVQGGTGGLTLQTGATSSGNSGSVIIQSGDAADGTSGNVSIDTGVGSVTSGGSIIDDTFETGVDDWYEWFGTGGDPTQSSAEAHSGTYSLAVSTDGTGYWDVERIGDYPGVAVTPGNLYTFSMWVRGTYSEPVNLEVYWGGAGTYTTLGTATDTTTGWTQITGSATAPAGATNAMLIIGSDDDAVANTTYVDDITMSSSSAAPVVAIGTTNAASVIVGNTSETGPTLIQGGGGGIDLAAATGDSISVGVDNTASITVGSTSNDNALTLQGNGISQIITGASSNPSDIIQSSINSTLAFAVQDDTGVNVITADTYDGEVIVGKGAGGESTAKLLVLDSETGGGADPTEIDGAMYYNATDESFRCGENGVWRSCNGGLVNSSTAASSPISNTTTKTNFSGGTNNSYGVLANDCQTGVTYTVTASGVYSTSGTPTLQLFLNEDGTSTALSGTSAITTPNNASNLGWQLTAQMVCTSTTSVEVQGSVTIGNATTSLATSAVVALMQNTSTLTWSASAHTLYIGAQWGTAASGNTVTMRQFIVQRLGP